MLLTLSLTFYAALGGATFARMIRYLDILETPGAKLRWVSISLLAALLWPVTFSLFAVLAWIARPETHR